MIKRCQSQYHSIAETILPPKNKHPFSTPDDETEPKFLMQIPYVRSICGVLQKISACFQVLIYIPTYPYMRHFKHSRFG